MERLVTFSSRPLSDDTALAFGERIAQILTHYRHRAGLTQKQLADKARVSRATVHLIESGRGDPRVSTLELLAKALNLDPAALTTEPRERDSVDSAGL